MPGEVKKLSGFVGFANLPNQVHRKSVKQGFEFTLLVVGEEGLGKATFVNSLFNANVIPKKSPPPVGSDPAEVKLETHSSDIVEGGVKLKLHVIETTNFGRSVDNSKDWEPIVEEVEERYNSYLDQERRVNRKGIEDKRVHCCLYFISPTGHTLRSLDIESLKHLHEKVNIIPVIAKSDSLTPEERASFKKQVLKDLEFHQIETYDIVVDPEDDEETRAKNKEFKESVPFAVFGANTEFEVNGKKVKARKFPWGVLSIEDEQYSDFIKLRNMLIKTHMVELRFKTNEVLYEKYRSEKLLGDLGGSSGGSKRGDTNPLAAFEEEKKQHETKMKKMEKEMKQVFEQKVKEKEDKLKQSEKKLHDDHNEAKAKLEKEIRDMEEKRKTLNASLEEGQKKPKKKSGLF